VDAVGVRALVDAGVLTEDLEENTKDSRVSWIPTRRPRERAPPSPVSSRDDLALKGRLTRRVNLRRFAWWRRTQSSSMPYAQGAVMTDPEPNRGPTASYAHLGERVGQILTLAEEEAARLRDEARADAEQERDAAERDASARRHEAETMYEEQQARAAAASADFETAQAERRRRSNAELREEQSATQAQLDELRAQLTEQRSQGRRDQESAESEAARVVQEAEERAAALVQDAQTTADRIREESDSELAAASQRRDGINQQLANVRRMLASLSTPTAVADPPTQPEAGRTNKRG